MEDDIGPPQVVALVEALEQRLPEATVELDAPLDPAGAWWVDVSIEGRSVTANWQDGRGYGEFQDVAEFGSNPDRFHADLEPLVASIVQFLTAGQ